MKSNYTKNIQVLVEEETYGKLVKLIGADALEKGTKLQTVSGWLRQLIEDTIDFEFNKKKIEEFSFKQQIKNIEKK